MSTLDPNQDHTHQDAHRWETLDQDQCMLCAAHGPDMRSLFVACFYAIHEVCPEAIDLKALPAQDPTREHCPDGYYLRICKTCRAGLLDHLGQWRQECLDRRDAPKDADGAPLIRDPHRNIPVRIHGTVRWLTKEEYARRHPGRTPITLSQGKETVF